MRGFNESRRVALHSLVAAVLTFLSSSAASAQDYPNRPVRVIVPYAAGGPTDTLARAFSDRLSQMLGQQFVAENKAGAGGTIGAELVLKAPKDGYTLLAAPHSTLVITPHTRQTPFAFTDFVAVGKLADVFAFIVVHPSVPSMTMREFAAYSKANRGKVHYGSASVGGIQHLRMEAISRAGDLGWVNVPYKGSSEAVLDTLAGHLQLMSDPLVMPYMKTGRLHALALLDSERHPEFPDVPTLKEAAQGLPFENVDVPSLQSFFVATGTPDEVVRKLNKAMIAIAGEKELRERLFQSGFRTRQDTVEKLAADLPQENRFFADLIKQVGLKQE